MQGYEESKHRASCHKSICLLVELGFSSNQNQYNHLCTVEVNKEISGQCKCLKILDKLFTVHAIQVSFLQSNKNMAQLYKFQTYYFAR